MSTWSTEGEGGWLDEGLGGHIVTGGATGRVA